MFGCIYFAVRGVWTHAVAAFLLAFVTFGLSWLIYPFFAQRIVETNYLRRGWVQVTAPGPSIARLPNVAAPPNIKSGSSVGRLILIIVGLTIGFGIFLEFLSSNRRVSEPTGTNVITSTPTTVAPSTRSQNIANDRLLALPKDQQAVMLGKIVPEGCKGTSAFYMGIAKTGFAQGKAFWSVRCSSGRSYGVEIEPDATGSTTILECAVLKSVAGTDCFKKIPQ